jgi:hypothetical protein
MPERDVRASQGGYHFGPGQPAAFGVDVLHAVVFPHDADDDRTGGSSRCSGTRPGDNPTGEICRRSIPCSCAGRLKARRTGDQLLLGDGANEHPAHREEHKSATVLMSLDIAQRVLEALAIGPHPSSVWKRTLHVRWMELSAADRNEVLGLLRWRRRFVAAASCAGVHGLVVAFKSEDDHGRIDA